MFNIGGPELLLPVLLLLAIGLIVLGFLFGRVLTMWMFGTAEILVQQKITNELLQRVIELADDGTKETAAVQVPQVRPQARNPLVSR